MVTIKNPVKQAVMPFSLGALMLSPACKKEGNIPAPLTC